MRLCEQKTTGHTYYLGIQWIIWEIVIDCNTKIDNKISVSENKQAVQTQTPCHTLHTTLHEVLEQNLAARK